MSRYLGRSYLEPAPPILSGTSSPDGVVSAAKGTLYVNTSTGSVWQNIDGATAWRPFGQRQIPWAAGRYYIVPPSNTSTSLASSNNQIRGTVFYVPNQVTITKIGAEVTSAGDVGSKVRLGIYADDGTGRPGALVVDAGQIAGDSVASQEITLGTSVTIGPGVYWNAWAAQSASSVVPTMRVSGTVTAPIDGGSGMPGANAVFAGFSQNSVSGALPSTATPVMGGSIAPRIFVKT